MLSSPARRILPALVAFFVLAFGAAAQEMATGEPATGMLPLVSRWLHIFGAIFLLGGAFYLRAAVMPAAAEVLDAETHAKLRAGITARWRKYIHILIAALLITGLYNFMAVTRFEHDGQSAYHMLFGIKFLLAIAIFGLASMLAGKKAISQKLQEKAGLWVGVTILLGAATVMIAGYMKMM